MNPLLGRGLLLAAPFALLAALQMAAGPAAAQDAAEPALAAVAKLGRLNGQALACQDGSAARRAKALMLAHAPKTARFGQAFEDATQQAFLATTRGESACPPAPALGQALDGAARDLQTVLPAAAR
jgi:hypothetical protein